MKSHISESFRKHFAALPSDIREQARAAYRLFRAFRANPRHPGLNFKHVHGSERLASVRVRPELTGRGLVQAADEVVRFWIGPHEQYESLLSRWERAGEPQINSAIFAC